MASGLKKFSPEFSFFSPESLIRVSEFGILPVFLPAFYATMIKPYLNLDWSYKIIIMLEYEKEVLCVIPAIKWLLYIPKIWTINIFKTSSYQK